MTRKVPSIVKSTLNPKVMFDTFGNALNPDDGWYPFSKFLLDERVSLLFIHLFGLFFVFVFFFSPYIILPC